MTDTAIEWTTGPDGTKGKAWNPTTGCNDDEVSPGCENCYARRAAHHPRLRGNSMGDLFHEDVPGEFIAAVFGVMAACPQHTFQVLTKRAERMAEWFEWATVDNHENLLEVLAFDLYTHNADEAAVRLGGTFEQGQYDEYGRCELAPYFDDIKLPAWPLPNVYLGVTAEDQQRADERIPILLQTLAAVRFVSVEPMLGPVDLSKFMWPVHDRWPAQYRTADEARASGATVTRHRQALVHAGCRFLDWVICGAETGPGARPMDLAWARSLLGQCQAAGVPFFFKQPSPGQETPPDLAIREWPEVRCV